LLLAVKRMTAARTLDDWPAWYHAGGVQFPTATAGALTLLAGRQHRGLELTCDRVRAVLALITPGYRLTSTAGFLRWMSALKREWRACPVIRAALRRSSLCDGLSVAAAALVTHRLDARTARMLARAPVAALVHAARLPATAVRIIAADLFLYKR
jgi:hypothetical protein